MKYAAVFTGHPDVDLRLLSHFRCFFVNLNVTLFPADVIFTCDIIPIHVGLCYSAYMVRQFRLSVRLYVRPSVIRVDFIKTAEHIIEILSLSDRTVIL